MRPPSKPDLAGLALLARSGDPAIRPLLLQAQAAAFAAAPARGRDEIRRFETLALGLIPFSTSDVLSDVEARLRRLSDPPGRVLAAIAERLAAILGGRSGPAETPEGEAEDASDLALARDEAVTLDGAELHRLVERARAHGGLAAALLPRPELTAFDRAALYRFADRAQRGETRERLSAGAARPQPPLGSLSPSCRTELLQLASGGHGPAFLAFVGVRTEAELRYPDVFTDEAESELLALSLTALGIEASDVIRVLLTLDGRLSRSVERIFALAAIVKETSRPVAAEILRCAAGSPERMSVPIRAEPAGPDRQRRAALAVAAARATGDPRAFRDAPRLLPPRPGASDLPDRRWRATTGPDRS